MTCTKNELNAKMQRWIEYEKDSEKLRSGDTTIFLTAIGTAGAISDVADVLMRKGTSFNLLESSKSALMGLFQNDDAASQLTASTMTNQGSMVSQMSQIIDDVTLKVNGLKVLLNNTPTYVPNKETLAKTLEDYNHIQRATQASVEQTPPLLQGLVDKGLLSQESVDNYTNTMFLSRSSTVKRSMQVVNELRERYYTIGSQDVPNRLDIENAESVELVDENGDSVKDVSGFDPDRSQLTPDGEIIMQGEDGLERRFKLVAKKPQKKHSRRRPSKRDTITGRVDQVEGELKYEVWACLILDVVEWLDDKWKKLKRLLRDMIAGIRNLTGLTSGLSLGSGVESFVAYEALGAIVNDINDLLTPGDDVREILGMRGTMTASGLPGGGRGGRTICDFNHEKYCNIRANLEAFVDNILSELDSIDLSFGGFPDDLIPDEVGDFLDMMEEFIASLESLIDEGQELVDKLKGDVCAFVSRRMRGTPKSLSNLQLVLSQLAVIIIAAPSFFPPDWGLQDSEVIQNLMDRLNRAGYDEAAAALFSGDIMRFLRMDENSATGPGSVAVCLRELARDEEDARKSVELEELARVADSRANQATMGQRIREGARDRYYNKSGVQSAQAVGDRAGQIIDE